MRILAIITLLLTAQFLCAKQDIKSNVYRDGDRACMVGDSITAGGWYTSTIMLYYATRFPHEKIDFRNIGISGDGCHGILWRMDWDIVPQLDKSKAVTVLMIGMNDVGRNKFSDSERRKLGADGLQRKIDATRKNYADNLAKVVDALADNSRKLVVFTPSIYDQTAKIECENLFGVNDELVKFGEIGKSLAAKKSNAATVDMSDEMLKVNGALQAKEGADKTIVGRDRVHPSFTGALVMLNRWLKDFKEPSTVSEIALNAKSGKLLQSFNTDISNLKFSKGKISFDSQAEALPFPVESKSAGIDAYLKFQEIFNREILKIEGLEKGIYRLKIDGQTVGEYDDASLAKGVNLAANTNTPQYKQAENVYKLCSKFRGEAAKYRSIFMIELFNRKIMDKLDIDGKIEFAKKKFESGSEKNGFVNNAYKNYATNKKKQRAMFENLLEINEQIYRAAKPKMHSYELAKTN